jgi:long-subunit fatty acid transport protein
VKNMRKLKMKNILILGMLVILSTAAMAADNMVVPDPMSIGVGARPLGMGRAYVAVAEDGDTIFINPAGLGNITSPKITSMYTSLMGDVNYMVLGGAYPTSANSAIGAGIVSSGVSGISLYGSTPGAASTGTATWGNSVIFVSYGTSFPDTKLSVGGSAKYYVQGGSGSSSIESATSTAFGFDVGATYSPTDNITLGITAQNPLGTKLESGNGIENSLIPTIKVGGKITLYPLQDQKLNLALDCDLAKRRPSVFHAGAEYYPIPSVALRAGAS